jgi:hypothetical protein
MTVTLAELRSSWSFADLMAAHDVLDAFDVADADARVKSANASKSHR